MIATSNTEQMMGLPKEDERQNNRKLICLVRQYRCLWDKSDPYNVSLMHKQFAWQQIAKKLNNSDETEVAKKWMSIRHTYKQRGAKYYLAKPLAFLNPYIEFVEQQQPQVQPAVATAFYSDSENSLHYSSVTDTFPDMDHTIEAKEDEQRGNLSTLEYRHSFTPNRTSSVILDQEFPKQGSSNVGFTTPWNAATMTQKSPELPQQGTSKRSYGSLGMPLYTQGTPKQPQPERSRQPIRRMQRKVYEKKENKSFLQKINKALERMTTQQKYEFKVGVYEKLSDMGF